jgi:phage terminase large subunit-like protein
MTSSNESQPYKDRLFPELTERQELLLLLMERERRQKTRKWYSYYPETGELRRDLYPKHCEFFRNGLGSRVRLALAANRIGKTEGMGGYELVAHLTGNYPEWWQGRRFSRAVTCWVAGDTAKTVRDIVQLKLLGQQGEFGTGLIPEALIGKHSQKPGVPEAVEMVRVRHTTGNWSTLYFKSYDQGRDAFQGTEIDVIWLDEEPPMSIYTECVTRTMTNDGIVMLTFTPLEGMSDVVMAFLNPPDGLAPGPITYATWDDVPHLSKAAKDGLWKLIPPYQRDARSKGIPQLGSGAIFPVSETDVIAEPFPIPDFWPRVFGLDVGWNRTAAIFAARDPESGRLYLYSEHYQGNAEPAIHAKALRARGAYIHGVIDPASRGRTQTDGQQLISIYQDLGLHVEAANNAVEAGLYEVWTLLSSGQLKVFKTLENWLREFRLYRRDEKGKVVKKDDHLMDATRYLIMSGRDIMRTKLHDNPVVLDSPSIVDPSRTEAWMG